MAPRGTDHGVAGLGEKLARYGGTIREAAARTPLGCRVYFHRQFGSSGAWRPQRPAPRSWNGVLQSRQEWEEASEYARSLGLPLHQTGPKNWDSLAALDCILRNCRRSGAVLDAGGERYSVILPWLWLYGYRRLTCANLAFDQTVTRGSIRYEYGDITASRFADASFQGITCLSVVEHGVPLEEYFRECWRVLTPGGVLITSTDFFCAPVDTGGKVAFGVPVRIFDRDDVSKMVATAQQVGFELTGELDLSCSEKAVVWEEVDLAFTFVVFTLRKPLQS
ncbi:MAG TPA: methyltransferase domain-containing protein [Acidimicrobiales bacterium]|nr:methyltransferase domain-containing protein [Acidimicrobiales bacterium]